MLRKITLSEEQRKALWTVRQKLGDDVSWWDRSWKHIAENGEWEYIPAVAFVATSPVHMMYRLGSTFQAVLDTVEEWRQNMPRLAAGDFEVNLEWLIEKWRPTNNELGWKIIGSPMSGRQRLLNWDRRPEDRDEEPLRLPISACLARTGNNRQRCWHYADVNKEAERQDARKSFLSVERFVFDNGFGVSDFPDELDPELFPYFSFTLASNMVLFIEQPEFLNLDSDGNPHSTTGPAIQWSDGFKMYAVNGLPIPPLNTKGLTSKYAIKVRNQEVMRVVIRILGEEQFLKDLNFKVVDQSEFGTLLRSETKLDNERLMFVRVVDASLDEHGETKVHYLRVPEFRSLARNDFEWNPILRKHVPVARPAVPIRNAKDAVAWTFDMLESEYNPEIQT